MNIDVSILRWHCFIAFFPCFLFQMWMLYLDVDSHPINDNLKTWGECVHVLKYAHIHMHIQIFQQNPWFVLWIGSGNRQCSRQQFWIWFPNSLSVPTAWLPTQLGFWVIAFRSLPGSSWDHAGLWPCLWPVILDPSCSIIPHPFLLVWTPAQPVHRRGSPPFEYLIWFLQGVHSRLWLGKLWTLALFWMIQR